MNTETYININEDSFKNLKIIHPPEIEESDKVIIRNFVNISRDFIEIYQLFSMFLFNFKELEDIFVLKGNDKLKKIRYKKSNFDDLTIINALTINYISAGVSFMQMLEAYLKNNIGEEVYKNFKADVISKEYDNCFSYRFVEFLRNYSQHAHLIVSCDINGYCFDLNKLIHTPHFNYKKSILNEMKDFIEQLFSSIGDSPRIAYSRTIIEYKLCLSIIYLKFLNEIEKDLMDKISRLYKLLINKPEIINKSDYNEFNNAIIYDINEDNIDIIKLEGDLSKIFYDIKSKIEIEKRKDSKRLNDINKNFKYLKFLKLNSGKKVIMNNMNKKRT